jgi:hypothetical protein
MLPAGVLESLCLTQRGAVPRRVLVISEEEGLRDELVARLQKYKFTVQGSDRILLRVVVDSRPDLLVIDVPAGRAIPIVNMLQMLSLSDDTKRLPVLLLVDSVKEFKVFSRQRVLPIQKTANEETFIRALKTLIHVPQLG